MLNSVKVGSFIMNKRREQGMTQQRLAERLNISLRFYNGIKLREEW